MSWTGLEFSPLVPWPFIIGLLLVAFMIFIVAMIGRARASVARLVFILLGLIVLANPVLLQEQRQMLPDEIIVILDRSASQGLGERLSESNAMLDHIRAELEGRNDINLRVVEVGGEDARETLLLGPLSQAIADVPTERLSSVMIISDGLTHDDPAQFGVAGSNAPIHLLMTGSRDMVDRRLIIDQSPAYAIVGRPVEFTVRVVDNPDGPGNPNSTARLRVRQDGVVVYDQDIPVGLSHSITITPSKRGEALIDMEIAALAGESVLTNNRAVSRLNAVRDRMRVLLVSGTPHAGERVWRSVLKADPAVDLIHFTILRLPSSRDNTPVQDLALIPFPTEELFAEQLHRFDLVIFDRYTLRGVLLMQYLQNLADYVQDGGAILVASGPEMAARFNLYATPLGQVLPSAPTGRVIDAPYRPALTAIGARHPITSVLARDAADWGRWFRMIETTSVAGHVLMEGADHLPLLTTARMGKGRVAQLTSDQIWMWARGVDGGGPHRELLRRIVHWLMKEPDLEEESLRATADGLEVAITRTSLENGGGEITVTAPDGSATSLGLVEESEGRASASYSAAAPGLYSISDGELSLLVPAGDLDAPEWQDIIPDASRLAPLAKASGGGTYWLDDGLPRLNRVAAGARTEGRNWLGLPEKNSFRTVSLNQDMLIPPLLAALLLLGGLLGLWWRESR
jgi:hypothetical protein